jgi:hypothetical protein
MANKTAKLNKHQAKDKTAEKVSHTFDRLSENLKKLPNELKL